MSKTKLSVELASLLKKRNEIKSEIEQLETAIILLEGKWLRKNGYVADNQYEKTILRN